MLQRPRALSSADNPTLTPTTASSPSPTDYRKRTHTPVGVFAGGAVVAVLVLAIITVVIVLYRRSRKKHAVHPAPGLPFVNASFRAKSPHTSQDRGNHHAIAQSEQPVTPERVDERQSITASQAAGALQSISNADYTPGEQYVALSPISRHNPAEAHRRSPLRRTEIMDAPPEYEGSGVRQ